MYKYIVIAFAFITIVVMAAFSISNIKEEGMKERARLQSEIDNEKRNNEELRKMNSKQETKIKELEAKIVEAEQKTKEERKPTKRTITKSRGVYHFNGRKETYYSSRVLKHKDIKKWKVDEEGFWRDKDGNYVVAASDIPRGSVFEGSKGKCIVLDYCPTKGTTDYYVNW